MCRLNFLFGKDLQKALQIIERGQVKCYVAEQSQRKVFQVWPDAIPYQRRLTVKRLIY